MSCGHLEVQCELACLIFIAYIFFFCLFEVSLVLFELGDSTGAGGCQLLKESVKRHFPEQLFVMTDSTNI